MNPLRRLLAAGFAALLLAGIYLSVLGYQIRSKFEAHRWNLPSRVYSDAFYLYPGKKLSTQGLAGFEDKLKRLGYKRVPVGGPHATLSAGEYARSPGTFTIFLHNFPYPSGDFTGFPVAIDFADDRVKSIRPIETADHPNAPNVPGTHDALDTHAELKTLKLEPELIASIFDEKMEDRTVVTLDQIPEELTQAVVAIEDERFYSHHGVDPIAIVRAVLTDILHLRFVQGGSTLTQQLVKNYFLSPRKTVFRKFNEMVMALLLELRYSKEEILEAYLNEIYFGQRGPVSVAGVEEASRLYFSKGISQLSLAESALLAGMIRLPGEYSPRRNLSKAYDRRNFVLKSMEEKKLISKEEYEKARREKIVVAPEPASTSGAPFFIDFVKFQLKENYPPEALKSEGLRIFTTLDMETQTLAEREMVRKLEELEKDRALLKENRDQGKSLEAAVISLQPQTGYVRAYVGGRDYSQSQFDRIALAHRQPGSAFKPFVYLTALSDDGGKWTLATKVEDRSFTVPAAGGAGTPDWTPENYDHQEHGTISLREALEESYNIATARLAIDIGLEKVVATARRAGIASPLEPYPAVALGSFEVTPLELVRAYTIFPNEGVRSEPISITDVMTREGTVLERKGIGIERVVTPEVAYLMNSALRGVIDRGTASSARALGFQGLAAGKTGTTSEWRDSWFVGYTPRLLSLVWVGYDDGTTTGLSGASGALPIWVDLMRQADDSGEAKDFNATDKILLVRIDRKTGLLASLLCGESYEEAFVEGRAPHESCRSVKDSR